MLAQLDKPQETFIHHQFVATYQGRTLLSFNAMALF
jgi:hypothetical protein